MFPLDHPRLGYVDACPIGQFHTRSAMAGHGRVAQWESGCFAYSRLGVRFTSRPPWGYSSVGRALPSQRRGRGFEFHYLHLDWQMILGSRPKASVAGAVRLVSLTSLTDLPRRWTAALWSSRGIICQSASLCSSVGESDCLKSSRSSVRSRLQAPCPRWPKDG